MNNITNITFILDKSGSMWGLESDTIGGFNSMLNKQKHEDGQAYLNTVLFNSKMDYLHKNVPIEQVEELTEEDYRPGGCTALLDAVGNTISQIDEFNNNLPDNAKPDKTIVIIITDGMENASEEYSLSQIKKLVKSKQDQGDWEFIFLGANIDAIQTAGSIGIAANRAANFNNDSRGIGVNFAAVSGVVSLTRQKSAVPDDWKAAIEADYNNRNKD